MVDNAPIPEGYTVDAVDWLPSGARSGLVRVRGHRPPAVAGPLPELLLEHAGERQRFVSLPDPRADRDPSAWRGAYVLDARPAAEADGLWLEWPGGRRMALPPLDVPAHQVVQSAAEPEATEPSGEVVDRAVLAERRARRAEAAEQAQARIAQEALRAVEVLELRAAELEQRLNAPTEAPGPDPRVEALNAEVEELRAALAEAQAAPAPAPEPAPAPAPASPPVVEPIRASEAERRAERLRGALTATVAVVAELRMRLHEADVARRTRDVGYAADAVRLAVLEAEHAAALAELEGARARVAELEAQVGDGEDAGALRARLEAAEIAREVAEATALAATTQRQAAAVAEVAQPVLPEPEQVPGPSLIAAAREQAQRTEELAVPEPQVVADLDAAREKLRQRPTVVSPSTAPPADVARGRGGRAYTPLRGALVKLAHDDPRAAGRLLAGLLPAQHAAVREPPPDYDLTIEEVGTFAVSAAGRTTLVSPLDKPRGRGRAAFHLRADAVTLAELLGGVERRAHRLRGPLRATGRVRDARRLTEGIRTGLSFGDLVRAGADLDPALVLRGLVYAAGPAWTEGERWAVELVVGDRPVSVVAGNGSGLAVTDGPHDGEPDARLRLSAAAFRDLAAGDPVSYATEGDEEAVERLLAIAARARGDA